MTLDEAKAYLSAQNEHHPSSRIDTTYLDAARSCYESLDDGARNGLRKRRKVIARPRFSRELVFEMRLAVDQRGGD
jgi:hypothetical protein